MRCAYEAANTLEAHMIANLLEQQDIDARVDGEYLTSGVGELPAMGLVRVMVNDEHFSRARQIITKWESESPQQQPAQETARRGYGPIGFVLGIVVATGVVTWIYRSPVAEEGVDYDGDGRMDERYIYGGRYIRKIESDRNLDGKVDLNYDYDARGLLSSSLADNDFDGRFETRTQFARGNPTAMEIDANLDGRVDQRLEFMHGVLIRKLIYANDGHTVVKREHYQNERLLSAELDSDADGVVDVTYEYDRYGEIRRYSK